MNAAQPPAGAAAAYCVDDSAGCIAQRQATLKTMMADPKRSWVRQPAGPYAYAAGVRLFAFRGKKRELTCDELSWGRKEAEAAPAALKGATGITPAQASRGTMLAAEVSRELSKEFARRCRRA
jgi:hypothetical protein